MVLVVQRVNAVGLRKVNEQGILPDENQKHIRLGHRRLRECGLLLLSLLQRYDEWARAAKSGIPTGHTRDSDCLRLKVDSL